MLSTSGAEILESDEPVEILEESNKKAMKKKSDMKISLSQEKNYAKLRNMYIPMSKQAARLYFAVQDM